VGSQISPEAAQALACLFRAESRGLFRYACTLPGVCQPDAEDLVQVTFQAAAESWGKLRFLDEESRRRWLYRVLQKKAVDRWRSVGSREARYEQTSVIPESSQDHRGLPYEEFAAALGVKLATVRSRIHRGRARLEADLAHRQQPSGPSSPGTPGPGKAR
jgi:DNA-directed RNA polymerase specialized sigma24 family protein